ncbi:hypothetical protein V6N13_139490 [Hibiscus sabdariffa]
MVDYAIGNDKSKSLGFEDLNFIEFPPLGLNGMVAVLTGGALASGIVGGSLIGESMTSVAVKSVVGSATVSNVSMENLGSENDVVGLDLSNFPTLQKVGKEGPGLCAEGSSVKAVADWKLFDQSLQLFSPAEKDG